MRTYLDVADRRAALEREDMVWNLLNGIKSGLGQVNHQVESLDTRAGTLSNQMETVANRLDDQMYAVSDQVDTLTNRFDGFTDQVASLTDQFGTLTNRVDSLASEVAAGFANTDAKFESFRRDLQRLSRVQEMMAARLALMPYPPAAPPAERRGLTRTNSLNALSDITPRMA